VLLRDLRGKRFSVIEITPTFSLDESEISLDFIRSSGPGGQNVNKVATAVQLRFDLRNSPSLPADVKERLVKLAGSRMTDEGFLLIEAKRYRTQEQNRADAILRLAELVRKALVKPKIRKKTKPSVTASAARVFEKKRRGAIKKIRSYDPDEWG
jgi:ribosome-associated protein